MAEGNRSWGQTEIQNPRSKNNHNESYRILVGTLYVNENEYKDCCASISRQTYNNYKHLVIENRGKQEAHECLYSYFMSHKTEFDLLIKVDADMVLRSDELFGRIVARFQAEPELDLLLIPVLDFFTNSQIIGLNIFRNSVRWSFSGESLFTDMTYESDSIRQKVIDRTVLAPAAMHSPNPSPFHAFHFGFHRGMKAIKAGAHWDTLKLLHEHYRGADDPRIALALLGANTAIRNKFDNNAICYSDSRVREIFDRKYAHQSAASLRRLVGRSLINILYSSPLSVDQIKRIYRIRREPKMDILRRLLNRLRLG